MGWVSAPIYPLASLCPVLHERLYVVALQSVPTLEQGQEQRFQASTVTEISFYSTGFLDVLKPLKKNICMQLKPFSPLTRQGAMVPRLRHQYLPVRGEEEGPGGSFWGGAWAE